MFIIKTDKKASKWANRYGYKVSNLTWVVSNRSILAELEKIVKENGFSLTIVKPVFNLIDINN